MSSGSFSLISRFCKAYQASFPRQKQRAIAKHIQRSLIVVLRSLPILLPVLLVSILLVFTDQGRGFLTLLENVNLPISLCALGIVANIYAHNLAPRIAATSSRPESEVARQYWYAQCSGALIVGGVAAILIPCFIDLYLGSTLSQSIPDQTRQELHFCSQSLAIATAVFFVCYLVFRRIGKDWSRLSSFALMRLIILFLAAGLFVYFVTPNYPACFAVILLIPLCLTLPPYVLVSEKNWEPAHRPSDQAKGLCVTSIVAGAFLCSEPLILMNAGSFVAGVAALIVCISVFVALEWAWLATYRRYQLWALFLMPTGVVLIMGLFADGLFTARPVRELAAMVQPGTQYPTTAAPRREPLEAYVQHWLDNRGAEMAQNGDHPYPIFIIAAPGGGIRSAYWTAGVLGALQDANAGFARHVLAISGVSGGAVGAGIFAALVKSACHSAPDDTAPAATARRDCQTGAANILAKDFLAPAAYSMFSRDLVSKLFSTLPDRATALEQAFEEGWQSTMHTELLAQPFDAMWDDDSRTRLPGLFFNITNAGSGQRLVLGPASITPVDKSALPAQRMVEEKAFSLSTAMILGARFPYISPEGFITPDDKSSGAPKRLRLVDGGLSDNSGMETILNILSAVAAATPPAAIKLYVLNIENSPVTADKLDNIGAFRAPFMLSERMIAGLAQNSKCELKRRMNAILDTTVLNEVRPTMPKSVYLLGWALPKVVRLEMNQQIKDKLEDAEGSLHFIVTELAAKSSQGPARSPVGKDCPPVQ